MTGPVVVATVPVELVRVGLESGMKKWLLVGGPGLLVTTLILAVFGQNITAYFETTTDPTTCCTGLTEPADSSGFGN
jgi:hypothetical protein